MRAAAGLGAVALAGALAWVHAPGATAATTTTVLAGDVLGGLTSLVGTPVDPATPMQVGLILSDPNAAGLPAAYRAVYDPASPSYHHFMTASQIASQFGVDPTTADAVAAWATRDGLTAVMRPADNEYLLLQGTAAQVQQTFSVTINTYTDGATTFYANGQGPTVPAAVDGVVGLNNLLKAHTFNHAPSASAPHGTPAPAPADAVNQDTCVGAECLGLTTPQDLWSAYDQPTNLADTSADFGQGQQMAVLGEGEVKNVIADLRGFEANNQLPQVPITVKSVGDDFKDTAGDPEWDIDMQASTGMAPKAAGETLYFAKDLTDSSVLGDFTAWSNDSGGPLQANASFGECEEDPTSPVLEPGDNNGGATSVVLAGPAGVEFTKQSNQELEQATLQGKTLFSSTGDTGSSCPVVSVDVNGVGNEAFPETNYPASSPFAVAVGGTVLYTTANTDTPPASNAQRAQETAWTYTGGGNTFYIARPDYQSGVSLLAQPCVSQPDGTPYSAPTPCRGVPDVAAQSGDILTNGYAVTMAGQNNQAGGGTSLSSPLWVGMWTRIQAASPSGGEGFANPALYKAGLSPKAGTTPFFDIGQGAPTSPVTGNGYYTSLPANATDPSGWDYVSGLGTPNVIQLGEDILGTTSLVPASTTGPGPVQDCGQPGLPACTSGSGSTGVGQTCSGSAAVWTNPDHTAFDALGNSDPQLSLLSETLALSADASTLHVTLAVEDMSSSSPPTGATSEAWFATWQYNGTEYFANAVVGLGGIASFGDGTYASGSGYTTNNADTGSFVDGPHGTVTIDVPVANIGGSSLLGSLLQQPAATTFIGEGVPPNPTGVYGGEQLKVDSGGPGCNWAVVGPASPSNSSVTANPTQVPADGTTASTITVVVKDAQGHPIPADKVTLVPSGGSSVVTPASAVTDSTGTAVFKVTDTAAETVTYTATEAGTGAKIGSATVTFTSTTPVTSPSGGTVAGPPAPPRGPGRHH
ncbi:MAG TPA: protease pro-enzyme activation domain-containing protein [Acidimicrobiales bacterium]|nr:protease pro-enzyme activation domain-containing protein [Acidimicrobiales bacterium]